MNSFNRIFSLDKKDHTSKYFSSFFNVGVISNFQIFLNRRENTCCSLTFYDVHIERAVKCHTKLASRINFDNIVIVIQMVGLHKTFSRITHSRMIVNFSSFQFKNWSLVVYFSLQVRIRGRLFCAAYLHSSFLSPLWCC